MGFHKSETDFKDLVIIQPDVFGDERGYFKELFKQSAFSTIGLGQLHFSQDNLSYSRRGTLRGLHFQAPPYAQGKLVTVLQGTVLDVALDIRAGSPTYGKVFSYELKATDHTMLYVPPGFAHGFQVVSEECMFLYKCTAPYHKVSEGGVAWNDPALNIPWQKIEPIVSEKDQHYPLLADFQTPFQTEIAS